MIRFWSRLFLLLSPLLLGCSDGPPDSPEAQIRSFIVAGEQAVESKDLSDAEKLISPGYTDDKGRHRRDIVQLLIFYFRRHKNVHLLTRIYDLQVIDPDRARVSLHVGMAGVPIDTAEQLASIRADLYRFDVELGREDGEWLLQRAWWRQAKASDFFPQ